MKYALLSVTDKTGIIDFARNLEALDFILLSTGGTAEVLRNANIKVQDVSEYTGFPEILNGRVKTLHPKIYGGILGDRDSAPHITAWNQHSISPIDLVVCNLYDFRSNAFENKTSEEEAIEHIDIGGPCMIRAAAKNWRHVLPVVDPDDYNEVLKGFSDGSFTRAARLRFAAKAFRLTSTYDRMIEAFFEDGRRPKESFSNLLTADFQKLQDLRYGENPVQKAALYGISGTRSPFQKERLVLGEQLSYNNILDLSSAVELVSELFATIQARAVAIVKHTNPCGLAWTADSDPRPLAELFAQALACDPKSAFGGIIATNTPIDEITAELISRHFFECIAAPEISPSALEILRKKKKIRVLEFDKNRAPPQFELRSALDGTLLVQAPDPAVEPAETWRLSTEKSATVTERFDLHAAMTAAKFVKSNAIVLAHRGRIIGVGAGQMSRVDACAIAIDKAREFRHPLKGAVLASDAFFPFSDTVEVASAAGVTAIIQPGGSKRDQESIDAANRAKVAMYLTGNRHFRH